MNHGSHGNSVDKCPDRSYLFGSRFLSTIYKISRDTGEIVWRLGGLISSFNLTRDMAWSQQHDVRCQHQNETHTIISLLDNQVSPYVKVEDAERAFSRGLVVAVNEVDMTAELLASYDHPHHAYAPRRGSLQMLENGMPPSTCHTRLRLPLTLFDVGNIFIGWSERALQTEHSSNGTLLMQAQLKAKWMGSYRNFKFDFVGQPLTKPDVVAGTYFQQQNNASTHVYVSWNGDTQVRSWRLYSSSAGGSSEELLAEVEREGFETFLSSPTYAEYVKVVGIDGEGRRVPRGESQVSKTEEHPSAADSMEAGRVFAEPELNAGSNNSQSTSEKEESESGYDRSRWQNPSNSVLIFLVAAASFALGSMTRPWLPVLLSWMLKLRRAENEYEELTMDDELRKESVDSDDLTLYDGGLLDGHLDTHALPDR